MGREPRRDIVLIGSSLGGIEALRRLAAALPADFPAAICIAQHVSPESAGQLAALLGAAGKLPATTASEGMSLQPGCIYVAPPDHHMLLAGHELRVRRGPRENRHRPSIDVMFRSAAVRCGSRVIAVLLTGLLDDGVSGLLAVKRCGGLAIVQDPADAEYPDMPTSALQRVDADHVVPLDRMAALLVRLAGTPATPRTDCPESLAIEVHIAEGGFGDVQVEQELGGELSPFSCPACSGPLWRREEGESAPFRCHTGHAFSLRHLEVDQAVALERSLWEAIRTLNERATLLTNMASDFRRRGLDLAADGFDQRAEGAREHADQLRTLLASDEVLGSASAGGPPASESEGP